MAKADRFIFAKRDEFARDFNGVSRRQRRFEKRSRSDAKKWNALSAAPTLSLVTATFLGFEKRMLLIVGKAS